MAFTLSIEHPETENSELSNAMTHPIDFNTCIAEKTIRYVLEYRGMIHRTDNTHSSSVKHSGRIILQATDTISLKGMVTRETNYRIEAEPIGDPESLRSIVDYIGNKLKIDWNIGTVLNSGNHLLYMTDHISNNDIGEANIKVYRAYHLLLEMFRCSANGKQLGGKVGLKSLNSSLCLEDAVNLVKENEIYGWNLPDFFCHMALKYFNGGPDGLCGGPDWDNDNPTSQPYTFNKLISLSHCHKP